MNEQKSGLQDQNAPKGEGGSAEPQKATWIDRIKRSPVGVGAAAVAGLLIAAAAATDATDKLLIKLGIRPNALQLSENDARGRFSGDLTRKAWRRLFWTRRVVLATKAGYPEQEKNEIWASYMKSLEEWNSDLMVNILSLQQYYGSTKRYEFEGKIQRRFGQIHYCLESLRHPEGKLTCTISSKRDIKAIEHAIDQLNPLLYCFVTGLPDTTGGSCDQR